MSATGASRAIIDWAAENGWELVVTPYVIGEVSNNLAELPDSATAEWMKIGSVLVVREDVLTLDLPAIFEPAKDRPILFGALAWADLLLTLDRADFGGLMGRSFYGLRVTTPAAFLAEERAAGRLK
jgi:hypothetical protein